MVHFKSLLVLSVFVCGSVGAQNHSQPTPSKETPVETTPSRKSIDISPEVIRKRFCDWFTQVDAKMPRELERKKAGALALQKFYNLAGNDFCSTLHPLLDKLVAMLPAERDSHSWPGQAQFKSFYAKSCQDGKATAAFKAQLNRSEDTWSQSDRDFQETRIFLSTIAWDERGTLPKANLEGLRAVLEKLPRFGYTPNPGLSAKYLHRLATHSRDRMKLACDLTTAKSNNKFYKMTQEASLLVQEAYRHANEINRITDDQASLIEDAVRARQSIAE